MKAQGHQTVIRARMGKDGAPGVSSFKSIVFKRTNATIARPTGGSYKAPVPSGWSDGVPSGEEKLWMSTRIFTDTGAEPQQANWTLPSAVTDTADIDFEFSAAAENPGNPESSPTLWHNTATAEDIWMAVCKKSNGVWGDWEVSKIKGEQGDPGQNGKTLYTWVRYADDAEGGGISDTPAANGVLKKYIGFAYNKETSTASDDPSDYTWALFKGTDGEKGIPGDPGPDGATLYTWIKYADSLGEDGYPAVMYDTPTTATGYIGIAVNKTAQTEGTDPSAYTWSRFKGEDGKGIVSIVDYYAVSASKTTPPTDWTPNTPPEMTVTLRYLWKYTLTTYTDETSETTTPCVIGAFGVDGLSYRYSKWAEGVEYRNDNNPYYRDSNGQGIIDVVYTEAITIYDPNSSATPPAGFICRKTHNSSENIPLAVGEHWAQMNSMAPILTALVLADRIKANFIDVENLAANSAFIDSLVVNRLMAGIQNGQRVEITPDNKSINIYDADGTLASTFEGNNYLSISSLFGDQSGVFSILNRTETDYYGYSTGVSLSKGFGNVSVKGTSRQVIPISSAVYFDKGAKVTIGAGSGYINAQKPSGHGSIQISGGMDFCIATYNEQSCVNLVSRNTIMYKSVEAVVADTEYEAELALAGKNVVIGNGYSRLEIIITANGNSAQYGNIQYSWTDIANVSYTSDFYVSRYFANGLCLGIRNDNYVAIYDEANGMRMMMENEGYGLDFSHYGIKFKRNDTEGWKRLIPTYGMPFATLAVGTMNLNSTSPTMGSYKTADGGTMSVSRQSDGTFKVTVPSSWGSAYLVQLTTLGRTDSNNPMGASVYTISSGSFIVDTMSLKGTWVNEAKVMFLITRLEDFNV